MAYADAASLMTTQINDYATTLSCDARERPVQLTAAIASHRPEQVAREAFGMNPNKDVRRACHIALHQSGVLNPIDEGFIGVDSVGGETG